MTIAALGSWAAPLLNHLWQSTVFAGGVWLLTLALRRNAARLRFRLWMAASLKFLIPLSLLIALGARLPRPTHAARTQPAVAAAVEGVARPLLQAWPGNAEVNVTTGTTSAAASGSSSDWILPVLLCVWVSGTLLLLARWLRSWVRLRAAVRSGEPMTLADGTRALLMAESLAREGIEPGVFGIVRPVLVLPRGIAERLSAEQLDAIVAHEICHMRRRDNLTAALHMAVEALFWFHPLVWWLRARLVEERERACDEGVLETKRQPYAYAEGILNVCKFYVEAPLSCVSGVTGSDLKQRIARILSGQGVRKLDLRRKALLALACTLAVAVPVTAGLVRAAQGQTAMQQSKAEGGIAGTWQGTMRTPDGQDRRVVFRIAGDEKSGLSGTFYNLDPAARPIAASSVRFENGTLRFVNEFPGLTYEGKMSADRNSISGTLTQGGSTPLVLERATPETEWAIPAPPPRIPPMAASAHPTYEVATIKPSAPDARGIGLRLRGGELTVGNLSLFDLMKFVYQVQSREIVGGPGWMETDKWDIEAKPDTPGTPSPSQLREMMEKLLADRFGLRVHEEKREMAAYVLRAGKDGPKLKKSADASILGGFTMGPLGVMHAGGASMEDFVHVLQSNIVDRPVVDETGLQGRWDFTLQWAPDDSQFAGVSAPRPAAEDVSTLPSLFTAVQEQLGLQLESERTQVPVVIVDHVDRPSPN